MSQLALDFTRAPYSGAGTSRDAAEAIVPHLDRLERIVLGVLADAGAAGLTDQEIGSLARLDGNTVRPRRGSLVDLGYVEDSGLKRTTASGRLACVWRITNKDGGVE